VTAVVRVKAYLLRKERNGTRGKGKKVKNGWRATHSASNGAPATRVAHRIR
jgi:hypothetical protein